LMAHCKDLDEGIPNHVLFSLKEITMQTSPLIMRNGV
jgi:hypothetical protein